MEKMQTTTNVTLPIEVAINQDDAVVVERVISAPRAPVKTALYARLGPGALVDASKIPPKIKAKMLDKAEPTLVAASVDLPADPPKTAVHANSTTAEAVAQVDTSIQKQAHKARPVRGKKG